MVLLSMILIFSWAAIAQAQEGPADNEYGNPAPVPAVAATDTAGASDPGSTSASSSALSTTVLPSTGGATLLALGAGVLLVGSGLVARRMIW